MSTGNQKGIINTPQTVNKIYRNSSDRNTITYGRKGNKTDRTNNDLLSNKNKSNNFYSSNKNSSDNLIQSNNKSSVTNKSVPDIKNFDKSHNDKNDYQVTKENVKETKENT